ncbi:hypothetical protein [Vibrio sp. 10N]|uniref:hypothetical protein n=1 Tax=Vibrio sp. 10N TaxID=3058938 RepID=UPI002812EEBC|nr:hypothetical protein VB10N_28880 [Vibrio sp. 10N]
MKQLVILDPGLKELSGHHPASIEAIVNALDVSLDAFNNPRISVYCHKEISTSFVEPKRQQGVEINAHFITEYYQYFYQSPTRQQLTHYTLNLASEYYQAILKALENKDASSTVIWCHTLGWQHAQALYLALSKVHQTLPTSKLRQYHVMVGLMYHPFSRLPKLEPEVITRKMHHELALKRLSSLSSVQLLAADFEIQDYYQRLLKRSIDIQPCLLLGQEIKLQRQLKQHDKNQVLLFTGDAKPDKGFTLLPDLIRSVVPNCPEQQFIVQYTLTNQSSLLANIDSQLKQLNDTYSNLTLVNRFLDHQELMTLFQTSETIVLNYDSETYQYQSSGVLWLAAFFDLKVITLTKNWLEREAKRLISEVTYCEKKTEIVTSITEKSPFYKNEKKGHNTECYKGLLFTPLNSWLHSKFD